MNTEQEKGMAGEWYDCYDQHFHAYENDNWN